jgi:hypothetical protein
MPAPHALRSGALLAAAGVALGAFGAHALKAQLTPEALTTFETGVRYQMYAALALLILGTQPNQTRAPRLLLRLATTGDAKVLDGWLVLQMLLVLVLLVLLILLHVVLVVLRLLLLLGIEPHLAVYDRRRRGIVQDHLRSLRRLLVRRLKASSLRVLMLLLEQLLVRRRRCGKQHSTHLAVAHDLRPGLMLAEQAKEVALAPHVVLDRRLRVFSKLAGVHSPARIADGDLILRTEHLRALELMLQPALPHWGAHGRDGLAGCLSRAQ